MPALHIRTSRHVDCERNCMAVDLIEARLERSHSMKVSLVEGEIWAILVISSLARDLLRPLKKICAGFLAARKVMDVAPRLVVPVKEVSRSLKGWMGRGRASYRL